MQTHTRLRVDCRGFAILFAALLVGGVLRPSSTFGQSEAASVFGRVTDQTGGVVPDVEVEIKNVDTGVSQTTKTNGEGFYLFPSLKPGNYLMNVRKQAFQTVSVTGITLNVQENLSRNFVLQVGSSAESITVTANALSVNTTDGSVSTVVDRQFAENLPMNGRSFQTLIQLTPGVVLTTSTMSDAGQFSVNGQRASSNYFTVDGVSANIGVTASGQFGNGAGGALPAFSAQGGTNSLVSVDAMQEFRIQTSTYAPEFGRTPGAQVSIVTRSGTNQFHGTAFDYFRNDVLDANNWFNGYTNNPPLPKAEERQNDFGGTFSGPILKNRTFFFFSYEGLRLRLPQTALSTVPTLSARQAAIPAVQPFLNGFPLPNGPSSGTDQAQFNSTFSNRSTLDAFSIRMDHHLTDRLTMFGRYDYSPSELIQRGAGYALSGLQTSRITTQTVTVGTAWALSTWTANDLRVNYSRNNAGSNLSVDNFGGATSPPSSAIPFPAPFTSSNALFGFAIFGLNNGSLGVGKLQHFLQRQINVVDSLSLQRGSHSLKVGVDFRRLSPLFDPFVYLQNAYFLDVPSAESGALLGSLAEANRGAPMLFRNLGVFAQDTWRVRPRFTLTYGLRWDIDFVPATSSGPKLAAVNEVSNLSTMALAPDGTPVFGTRYSNVAPRVGVAYQLSEKPGRETVFRGGFGVFYDLATQEVGEATVAGQFPFGVGTFSCCFNNNFPLPPSAAAPPVISPANLSVPGGRLFAFDPKLKLPYVLQWNIAVEQSIGTQQTLTASYIGAVGRRLIQTTFVAQPNPSFDGAYIVHNASTSDYHGLQLQFQRRLARGLQALASYSWAHAIDTGSASSVGSFSNVVAPEAAANANRGPADFDIRNGFSVGMTYQLTAPKANPVIGTILRGWSIQNVVQARSALPVDVFYSGLSIYSQSLAVVRPDLIPGQPTYLFGSQYPGGKAFNAAAFTPPPVDPTTGLPLRQGDVGRNALRGFGATQWDLAVHRDFLIRESLRLQFRAELFNILNHPNFGSPQGNLWSPPPNTNPQFGLSTQMLGSSLNGPQGSGQSPLYQFGGPRSIQLALKLMF